MQITLDEGYQFGLGVFETIRVEGGKPRLLKLHLERMRRSLKTLGIHRDVSKEEVLDYLEGKNAEYSALKVMVSEKNTTFTLRENPYGPDRYEPGFAMDYSTVRRNETSPLVFHKTLNYADCILEKRRAIREGQDERIFLNSRGEICEGTSCNIFFGQGDRLYTPKLSCGLLPGVVRRVLLDSGLAEERILRPKDVQTMQECFVTNSLMEIMPVYRLGAQKFSARRQALICRESLRAWPGQ